MSCSHCNTVNPPGARFCSECGKPLSDPVAYSPAKDRIRQEIRSKEREIDNIQRNIDERTREYEANGYRNAEPGWSNRLYKEMDDLEREIRRLTSLL